MAVTNGGSKSAPVTGNVTTSAASLVADNPRRRAVMIRNNDASASIYLGSDATVTTSGATQGIAVAAGATFVDRVSRDAWWAIAGGTVSVTYIEVT